MVKVEGCGGSGNYVFALLDWRGSSGYKRRHIYDNHDLPKLKRLTKNKFDDWVQEMKDKHNMNISIDFPS